MIIKASDIFDVTIGNGSFPFDLQFEPKNSVGLVLKQPLVYVLRYQNTALYVGYSFVKKDVRVSRWTKQLESI
jgi:hypothetical protein